MPEQYVEVKTKDAIATITMNRPDIHNAFDEYMIEELIVAFEDITTQDDIRVVILRGKGKSFSAGGDLNWMRRVAQYNYDENVEDALKLGKLMKIINVFPKTVIGVIQGNAFGGGVGLASCCDIVLSIEKTRFCLSEVRIGLIPAVIAPYVISKIGQSHARRYFMTAEVFDAEKACEIGLVHEVVTVDNVENKLEDIIKSLMMGAPKAQAMAKQLIHDIGQKTIDDNVIQHTAEKIAEARSAEEGQLGLTAFLDKKSPPWAQL